MNDMKIKVHPAKDRWGSGWVEGAKRQYLPLTIQWTCPTCGNEAWKDFTAEYLMNPRIGGVNEVWLYCLPCDEAGQICEHMVKMKLAVSMEAAE